jgi:hypothetical protein
MMQTIPRGGALYIGFGPDRVIGEDLDHQCLLLLGIVETSL